MKDPIKGFYASSTVREILGNGFVLTPEQESNIIEFFTFYNEKDRYQYWRRKIAIWIRDDLGDWIDRRKKLQKVTVRSKGWYKLMYADWESEYKKSSDMVKRSLPSCEEYWINKGFSREEAKIKVSESQSVKGQTYKKKYEGKHRHNSVRCVEFWMDRGFTLEEAEQKVYNVQARNLDFFIDTYGYVEGVKRYNESRNKRQKTWETKDREEHGKVTLPKSYNPDGQEMQAVHGFIKANDIDPEKCRFGAPADQFYQYIPNVGYRRYDLAVYSDSDRKNLELVFEFHGPGHVNFSDYDESMRDQLITANGKVLKHLGKYGDAYDNDKAKRDHILNTYPGVKYVVMWHHDLKDKKFLMEELSTNG